MSSEAAAASSATPAPPAPPPPVPCTPESRRAWLRHVFDETDIDKNSVLDLTECALALKKAHLPSDLHSVRKMRYAIRREEYKEGISGTGRDIEFDEFVSFYEKRIEKLTKHFEHFSTVVSGTKGGKKADDDAETVSKRQMVLMSSLRSVVEQDAGCDAVSNETLEKVFKELDIDGDGEVTLDEWLRMLMHVPDIEQGMFLDHLFHNNFNADCGFGAATKPAAPVTSSKRSQDKGYLVLKKVACGAFSGGISRTATAPMDRVRVVMMVTVPKPTVAQAIQIILNDGSTTFSKVAAMWRGNGCNVAKVGPELAIRLQAYDAAYAYISGDDPKNANINTRLMAGACSGFLSECFSHPLDVVRTRLAAAPAGVYKGISHCTRVVWREGGMAGFYAGMVPSCMGIVPYAAVDLGLNSLLRERARAYMAQHNQTSNWPLLFSCGMVSSSIAMAFTFPLYVLKTKIAVTNEGFRHAATELLKEGPRGFYRGILPALVKVAPASGISYGVYDSLNRML